MDPRQKRGVWRAGPFRGRGSAAAEQARGGAVPGAGRLGAGPLEARVHRRCRRAGGQAAARSGLASGLRDRRRAMASSPCPAGVGGAGAVQASGPSGFTFDSGLEIKTRSVEQTLLPLVSQVK